MDSELKIMVVDDFVTMRKLIRNLLRQGGYGNVMEADDGVSALKMIKSQKVDFIISDWNMPRMTGLELLKAVRADAEISATPFLMVTGEAIQENVIDAYKAGVNNYIVKPFTAKVLSEKIAKIMAEIG